MLVSSSSPDRLTAVTSPPIPSNWNPYTRGCLSRDLLDTVGEKWAILILTTLDTGPHRFGEVEKAVDGISQKVLSQRLQALTAYGLVERTEFKEIPPRVEYALTTLGRSVLPILQLLVQWTTGHMDQVRDQIRDQMPEQHTDTTA